MARVLFIEAYGGFPSANSIKQIPKLQMSLLESYDFPRTHSGLMYNGAKKKLIIDIDISNHRKDNMSDLKTYFQLDLVQFHQADSLQSQQSGHGNWY